MPKRIEDVVSQLVTAGASLHVQAIVNDVGVFDQLAMWSGMEPATQNSDIGTYRWFDITTSTGCVRVISRTVARKAG